MELRIKHFSELTAYELHDILKVRVDVFVVEQNCPYSELDGLDLDAYHVWLEDNGEITAYLRVLAPGARFEEASIGRVLAVKRRQGLGSMILEEGIKTAVEKFGASVIRIEAQTYAKGLYEKAGFFQVSDEFLEDGIPHIAMIWRREENEAQTAR